MSQTEDRWTPRARVEPGGPEAHDRDELEELLEGSSLGSPVVKRIQAMVPAETTRRVRAHRPSLSAKFDVNDLVTRILTLMCRQAVAHRTAPRPAAGNTTDDLRWPHVCAGAVPRPLAPVDVWGTPGGFVLRVPQRMRAALRVIERSGGPDRVLHQLADDGVLEEVRDDVAGRIALVAAALMNDAPPGLLRAYAVVLERKATRSQSRVIPRDGNQLPGVSAQATFPPERPRPARITFEVHDRYVGYTPLLPSLMPVCGPIFRFLLHRHGEPDPACSLAGVTSSETLDFVLLSGLSHDVGKSHRSFQRAIRCRQRHGALTRCPECRHEWATGWPASTVNLRAAEHMLTGCAPADLSKTIDATRRRLLDLLGFRYRGSVDLSPHEFGWLPVRASDRESFDRVLRQRKNLMGRFAALRSPLVQGRNAERGSDEISA